jgi:hypothetical protein
MTAMKVAMLTLFVAVSSFASSSEPITPQPYRPPIFNTINIRTSTETREISSTLDNPCTAAREAIAFTGGMRLKQQAWTTTDGRYRVLLHETTSIQGKDAAGNLTYASGSSTSDIVYQPTLFTLLIFKKMNTPDQFHAVFVLDIDPVTGLITVKLEAACDNGLPK